MLKHHSKQFTVKKKRRILTRPNLDLCLWMFQTDERIEAKQGLGYVDYQTNMVKLAKNIAKTAQDMVCCLVTLSYVMCFESKKILRVPNYAIVI